MSRWLAPAILVLLLLGIYLAPQLPGVRDWLLGYALNAAKGAGYTVTYERTTGNVWSSLGLRNATVKGRGLDVALETLSLRYFLPSLITSELPLDIYAQGLTGEVDFQPTRTPGTTPSDPNVRRSTGGGLPIRVRLRDVNLQDISVTGSDVPFTLPNFSLSNLRVQNRGEVLNVVTSVATEEGSVDVEGEVRLEPFTINANVSRADVRIARHWWPGIDAGTAIGNVTVQNGEVRVNAQVVDGAISFLDGTVTDISGPVTMEDFIVRGNLTAQTLGGDITAKAGVDILKARWFGEAQSDTIDFREAALWLAKNRLPINLTTWPLSGTLQTTVNAEGWTDVAVNGVATGDGAISVFPLEDISANYTFTTQRGVDVDVSALLAGGQLDAELFTEGRDTVFNLTTAGSKLLPTVNADATVALRSGSGVTEGQTQVDLSGSFLGRDISADIPGTISNDGWQNTVTGTTSREETLSGVFVLGGVAGLEGQINGADIKIPGAPPLQLALSASGKNPASLPINLTLESPTPFNWSIAGVDVPVNDAEITGTLEAIVLKDVRATIGTLSLQGETWLTGENADVTFSLAETPLSNRVNGTLAATNGRVVIQDRVVDGRAEVQTGTLTVSGVMLQPIAGTVNFDFNETLTASLESPTLSANYDGATLTTNLNQTALSVVGQDIVATGSASLSPQEMLDTLSADVAVLGNAANLNIQGENGQLQITGTSSQLGTPLDIQSSVNLPQQTFSVAGSVNDIALKGSGSFGEALQVAIDAVSGEDVMTLNVTGTASQPELTLQGSLPAESLSPIVRVLLAGTVTADLSRTVAGYAGTVELNGEVSSIPVNATITGNGAELELGGTATAYGQELQLSGDVGPDIEITAQGEIGAVTLSRDETGFVVTGEGTTPVLNAGGFEVPAQPWSLSGPVNDLSLSVGGSELDIGQNNGLEISGDISQSIQRGGAEILLNAAATYRPATQASSINGTLTLSTATGQTVLPVRGSLENLQVSGNVAASEVASLAGLPISLAGDVALDGNVSLTGETSYDVTGVWQANGQLLNVAVQGSGANLSATINSDTLTASYTPQGFTINATHFDPAPFVQNIPVIGTLTGNLGQEQGLWVGSLDAAVTSPLVFSGRFEGQGETLAASLSYEQQGITATATGAVLPTLALDVNAAYRDLATLQGSLNGSFAEPSLTGIVSTKELRNDALGFVLPAQAFEVMGGLGETLLTLTNEGTNLTVARDAVTGQLVMPFTLKEQAHTLQADLVGSLTNPQIAATIAGALLNGQANVVDKTLQTKLSLEPSPWLAERNLRFLEAQPVSIAAIASSTLDWNTDIYTTGVTRGLPLELSASVRGKAATYDGIGALKLNGENVELAVTGSGATVQASAEIREADLAALRLLVGLPIAGVINGRATVDTTREQPFTFDVRATGQARGESFELSSSLLENQPLSLRGTYGTTIVSLQPEGAGRFAVRYIDSSETRPALVEGILNLSETFSLQAAGQLSGEEVTIDANYDPDAKTGSWQTRLAASTITGTASPEGEGVRLSTDVALVSGATIPLPIAADIEAVLEKGSVRLERSALNTTLGDRDVALLISGTVSPNLDLVGRFDVTGVDTTGFHVVRREDAYAVNLSQEGFAVDALLSSSFMPQSVVTRGELSANVGAPIMYQGDLSWQAASGFSGAGRVSTRISDLTATVDLTGTFTLGVTGNASWNGSSLATLKAILPANATGTLSGTLAFDASSSVFGSAYSASATNLKSTLALSGTVLKPVVQGSLQLSGSLLASGRLEYGLNELSRLELSGNDLNLLAMSDTAGWNIAFAANELDIASFLPQLTAPTLSTVLRAEGKRGQPLNVQVQNLALRSAQSQVTGQFSYNGSWQGDVQADVQLEDFKVAVPLSGRLLGDVLVNGETLSGNVQAFGLTLQNSQAELGGNVIVTGQLSSPAITARLIGSGEARGEVLFNLEPGQSTTLSSTLRVGEFASNLNVLLQRQNVQGEGTLSYGDYGLVFAKAAPSSSFTLLGQEKLLGWQLMTDLAAQRVSVSGDLASVVENATGLVQLSGSWANTENWLRGGLENLSFAGVHLGDVAVSSAATPRSVVLQGESVDAAYNVSENSWSVARLEPTWNNVLLSLSGAGRGSEANLSGTLSGDVAGESLSLPVTLSYLSNELALVSQGETLGGSVNVNVRGSAANGWQGDVQLQHVSLQGFSTTLDGTLTGAFSQPRLQATLSAARGENSLTGSLEVSAEKVALEQVLTASQLDRPLYISGTLFPQTDFEVSTSENNCVHLSLKNGELVSEGELVLNTDALRFVLESVPNDGSSVSVSYKSADGLTLRTLLPRASLSEIVATIQEQGLGFEGQDNTSGWLVVNVRDGLTVQANDLVYQSDLGTVTLTGRVSQANNWQGNLSAHWQGSGGESRFLPWLSSLQDVNLQTEIDATTIAGNVVSSAGTLQLNINRETLESSLLGSLQLGTGQLVSELRYTSEVGPSGGITLTDVPLFQDLAISSQLNLTPQAVSGTGGLNIGNGQITFEGNYGLGGFPALFPQGSTAQRVNVRLQNIDVQEVPFLAQRVPNLQAVLAGRVLLSGGQVVGRVLAPDLQVDDERLPFDLDFNGSLGKIDLRGTLGRSRITSTIDTSHAEGLVVFDQFPLQTTVEAAVGDTGVSGQLIGAARFNVPFDKVRETTLDFASESIRLSQSSSTDGETRGNVAFRYGGGALFIDKALFEGAGRWEASGQISPETLGFRLSARNADFTPILSLVPQLANFGLGAAGTLELSAQGSFADPQISVLSDALNVNVGGSSYQLQNARLNLSGTKLTTLANLRGISPITGNLTLVGNGEVLLGPIRPTIKLRATGNAAVPTLGNISGIDATITATPETGWQLGVNGRLGNPFTLTGSLTPLDLRLQGKNLNLRAPNNFLAGSDSNADIRVRFEDGIVISGAVDATQVNLDLNRNADSEAQPATTSETTATTTETATTQQNRFLERIRFENIAIRAPRNISFQENFGAAELGIDVVLTGTAAGPELSGEAHSIRGTFRFSGRDFTIDTATAVFQPSQGIYPTIDILAKSTFEKSQALRGLEGVEIAEPSGRSFTVFLNLKAQLVARENGGFAADVTETNLSSNATLEQTSTATTVGGRRELTEDELYSLLTLGRLQLASSITGEGSVAETVAGGALDTTLELFILSELQQQIGSVLGVDLFELRTTPLSSLLDGSTNQFGVSLRIGGYLGEDLFASYEIRTLDLEPDVAFSNEFDLRYEFDRLELDLTGRLNFRATSFTPIPEFSVGLGYALTPLVRVETSADISEARQSVGFGVSLRW